MVNYTPFLSRPETDIEMRSHKLAKDLMYRGYLSVDMSMSMTQACDLLESHNATGAPVVGEHNKLVGFISQKDCLKYLMDSKYYNDSPGNVVDYMSKTLMTIGEDEHLLYIVELFMKNHFQMYPVVDDDGILTGVISRTRIFCEMSRIKQTSWNPAA